MDLLESGITFRADLLGVANPRWHHETAVVDVSKTSNTEQQSITTESVAIWRGLFWATFFQGVVACAAALVWKLGTSGL